MVWVLTAILAAAIPLTGWVCWTYGYRRGIEDTIAANDLAREGFLGTMSQVSRR